MDKLTFLQDLIALLDRFESARDNKEVGCEVDIDEETYVWDGEKLVLSEGGGSPEL